MVHNIIGYLGENFDEISLEFSKVCIENYRDIFKLYQDFLLHLPVYIMYQNRKIDCATICLLNCSGLNRIQIELYYVHLFEKLLKRNISLFLLSIVLLWYLVYK